MVRVTTPVRDGVRRRPVPHSLHWGQEVPSRASGPGAVEDSSQLCLRHARLRIYLLRHGDRPRPRSRYDNLPATARHLPGQCTQNPLGFCNGGGLWSNPSLHLPVGATTTQTQVYHIAASVFSDWNSVSAALRHHVCYLPLCAWTTSTVLQ